MKSRLLTLVLFAACLVACKKQSTAPDLPPPKHEPQAVAEPQADGPQRIVLFIGDGMGIGQITAGMYAAGRRLLMLQMPHVGVMTTHEHEFLTTDSAASATAMSTGRKAGYEAVSVIPGTTEDQETDPDRHMQTLLELAASNGLRTGLVSTSRVNHATGAAFGAHRFHRHQYEQIAADFVASKIDVLIGPGLNYFTEREDGRDLMAEFASAGWATATSPDELAAIDDAATRVVALLHPKDYPFIVDEEPRAMPLADMVTNAIEVLDRDNEAGWVLVVEGSFVDWCSHNLDGACAAMEVLDLDAAVSAARTYAKKREDTLVVVTADHETSGMSVIDPYYSNRFSKILGGEPAAEKLVALPDGSDAPPPFQHIAIGQKSATLRADPLPNPNLLGMNELVDGRASIVMGHFSMASRPFWKSKGRFYGAHTPVMVSIHAEGPGAEVVARARDNADLGRAIREFVAGAEVPAQTVSEGRPKNVVLMIGDGMGLPVITAAHYWSSGLRMLQSDVTGLVSTHATDYLVNDSAATATALSTGLRTRKKAVGKVVRNGEFVAGETVLERAEKRGLATGLVTTTPVTHATPAAFYAHQDTRYEFEGITADLISLPQRAGAPEVVFGGGAKHFDEKARAAAIAAGYTIVTSWPPKDDAEHLLGLFAEDGLESAKARRENDAGPTLAAMTGEALRRLQDAPEGFFLMVEGGQIDWRLHEGVRDDSLLHEVVDFDEAVEAVMTWAEGRNDTLIIVTADHDHTLSVLDDHYAFESGRCGASTRCGGPYEMLALPVNGAGVRNTEGFADTELQGDYAPPTMYLQYAWPVQVGMEKKSDVRAPHSANFVPLFATGPGAANLGGFRDQPEIGSWLMRWADK